MQAIQAPSMQEYGGLSPASNNVSSTEEPELYGNECVSPSKFTSRVSGALIASLSPIRMAFFGTWGWPAAVALSVSAVPASSAPGDDNLFAVWLDPSGT